MAFCWVIDLFYTLLPVIGFRIALGVVFALSPRPLHLYTKKKKPKKSWGHGGRVVFGMGFIYRGIYKYRMTKSSPERIVVSQNVLKEFCFLYLFSS